MAIFNEWKEPILFVLVVLVTFFNILWSNKRVAALKAQVATLKDQLRFWEKLTPGEVSKHYTDITEQLTGVIAEKDNQIKKGKIEIANRKRLLTIEKKNKNKLEVEIEQLKSENEKLENRVCELGLVKENLSVNPLGPWLELVRKQSKASLGIFLEGRREAGMDIDALKDFWKHYEDEALEHFVDKSIEESRKYVKNNKDIDKE